MTAVLDRPRSTEPHQPAAVSPPALAAPARWLRVHWTLLAVTATSLALNAGTLSINGLGNQYYAAATRSMTVSWSNFLFASFDPGGFISVDKPPVALWIAALSARLFGVNSWSILLPSALAGTAAVSLLWCILRRRFGTMAATVGGIVLALSPVNVAVNRLNLPEPYMILFLIAAAWAILRSFDAKRARRWLVLAGVLMGLAFNTKMLAAFIPLPAIGVALVAGTSGWWEKAKRGLVFGATTIAVSISWLMIVDLTPASSRPFVGGSTNNTVRDLVFGYNGFGRVTGGATAGRLPGGGGAGFGGGAGPGGGAMGASGGIFGGSAGPGRLLSDALGGQIAWLVPLALLGAAAGAWFYRRDRERRAAVVLWTGWFALYAGVFSYAGGTFHAYYTSTLAPAIAALVGIGATALLPLLRRHRLWFVPLGIAVATTVALQLGLAAREPNFHGWMRVVLVAGVAAAAAGIAAGFAMRKGTFVVVALAIGLAGLLAIPGAWAASETANPVLNATLPQAGPRTGAAGTSFGSASSNGNAQLASYLKSQRSGQTWDLAVSSAQVGSGYVAYDDLSVMAIGGFMGSDNTTTVAKIADLVYAGQLRFFQVSGAQGGAGGRGGGPGLGGGAASRVMSAVQQSCTAVTARSTDGAMPASFSGTLYDCAGQAGALRAQAGG
ncbi:MAG: glycosyltransferase family 39 protein [Actinobacteria bacterium]|nr:glycosyltransferase family 39 protein [Actinomycetota bacterium]